jgi:predicted transcriptional regulator
MEANPKRRRIRLPDEEALRAILALILGSDPMARTVPELAREIGDRDRVERAVRNLAEYGLLEIQGGKARTLRPSTAARRCHRLDAW